MGLTQKQKEILIEALQEAAARAVFDGHIPSCYIDFTLHNKNGWCRVKLHNENNVKKA